MKRTASTLVILLLSTAALFAQELPADPAIIQSLPLHHASVQPLQVAVPMSSETILVQAEPTVARKDWIPNDSAKESRLEFRGIRIGMTEDQVTRLMPATADDHWAGQFSCSPTHVGEVEDCSANQGSGSVWSAYMLRGELVDLVLLFEPNNQFFGLLNALTGQYGTPTLEKTKFRNGYGAAVAGTKASWASKGITLSISQIATDANTGLLELRDTVRAKEALDKLANNARVAGR
jgi:hypothetical protein